jgi:hypothetical protein
MLSMDASTPLSVSVHQSRLRGDRDYDGDHSRELPESA